MASGKYLREFKGMMSSELEQCLLKSTRPTPASVKPKHVERLVGVTYQIGGQYDLYDPILRKLWAKMAERSFDTKVRERAKRGKSPCGIFISPR